MEAVRIGYLTANDRQALWRWRSLRAQLTGPIGAPRGEGVRGSHGGGLAGAELEQAVMALRITNPDIVAVRSAPRG